MTNEFLSEYYTDNDQLRIINMPFNILNGEVAEEWNIEATKVVAGLSGYSHIIVFITTHSDPNTGDLWIGEDKKKRPCSTRVSSVSTGLFSLFHTEIDHILNSGLTHFLGHSGLYSQTPYCFC
jgi:hypothetical protein